MRNRTTGFLGGKLKRLNDWRVANAIGLPQGVKRPFLAYLRATGAYRVLPDFLILGAQKAASTSLHNYVSIHPDVYPSYQKEVEFFNDPGAYARGLDWYRGHFATKAWKAYVQNVRKRPFVTGEATTHYLWHPDVPSRVARDLPHARLIAILRDPVSRAFSHFQHSRRNGKEHRSFAEAVESELELHEREADRRVLCGDDKGKGEKLARGYLRRGVYAEQLEGWWALFSREQLLVLKYDDLLERPREILERVYRHIGVPPHERLTFPAYNRGKYGEGIDPTSRRKLNGYYATHDAALRGMLGDGFSWDMDD